MVELLEYVNWIVIKSVVYDQFSNNPYKCFLPNYELINIFYLYISNKKYLQKKGIK